MTLTPNDIIKKIGNILFSLLLLVLMLDPGNSVLHLKDVMFVAVVGFNLLFFKPDIRFTLPLLSLFGVLFLGFIIANIQDNPIDYTYLSGVFKGLSPLLLLFWVRQYNVMRIARLPALITSFVILTLYLVIASSEIIQHAVASYSRQHNEMVMITTRNILGVKVFGMYYRSIVSIIPILFLVLYTAFNPSSPLSHTKQNLFQRFLYILGSVLLVFTFFISGTRAMMLTPIFMIGVIVYNKWVRHPKGKYILYPILVVGIILFLFLIFLLATQEGDQSNSVKYGHLNSYAELFELHPQYLLWGQGTGTTFYSEGFHAITAETEWIYLELIRVYGIFSVIILAIYLFPLYYFYRHRHDQFTSGFALCYVGFLFIAGTNPFLLNSQGMTVLWMVYSHVYHLQHSSSLCIQP